MARFTIGETIIINAGGTVTVLSNPNKRKIKIRHEDHIKLEHWVGVENLDIGNIKNPYAVTVFGKGYPGYDVDITKLDQVSGRLCHRVWYNMLRRCYKNKTTQTVWVEWLDYKVFRKWYIEELKLTGLDKLTMDNYQNESGCFMPKSRVEQHVEHFYLSYANTVKKDLSFIMDVKQHGVELGYPKCCIQSFVTDIVDARIAYRPDRKLNGTGFIPCSTCDVRFTEEELINKINNTRDASYLPFKI